MKIALIECPEYPLDVDWEDVYFPDTPFPISDFLHEEPNEVRVWYFCQEKKLSVHQLVQDLQDFSPVILGINDNHSTNGLVLERLIKQMFPRAVIFFCPGHMEIEDLLNSANESAFRLRQRTRPVSGKLRFRSSWPDEELFEELDSTQQSQAEPISIRLKESYHLDTWRHYLPRLAYRMVMQNLEILEDCFPESSPVWSASHLRLLDVGSARWAYAPALYEFFTHAHTTQARQFFLTGLELDPYRLDHEGYSCVDHALSYIDPIASFSRYLNQNILAHTPQQTYDVITLFNPYTTINENLIHGLPLEFFQPDKILNHLQSMLTPDIGKIVITHQDKEQFLKYRSILAEAPLKIEISGAFKSSITGDFHGFITLLSQK